MRVYFFSSPIPIPSHHYGREQHQRKGFDSIKSRINRGIATSRFEKAGKCNGAASQRTAREDLRWPTPAGAPEALQASDRKLNRDVTRGVLRLSCVCMYAGDHLPPFFIPQTCHNSRDCNLLPRDTRTASASCNRSEQLKEKNSQTKEAVTVRTSI